MSASAWHQFIFIMGLGFVVAGLTTYIITWMLVAVHLRDRHPAEHARLGAFLFAPRAFGWYLAGSYRALRDRGLNALGRSGADWVIMSALTVFRGPSSAGSNSFSRFLGFSFQGTMLFWKMPSSTRVTAPRTICALSTLFGTKP
jgi:hypothetical protein